MPEHGFAGSRKSISSYGGSVGARQVKERECAVLIVVLGRNSCGEEISGGDVGIAARLGVEGHVGPTYTTGVSVNLPSVLQEAYEFPLTTAKEIGGGF